MSYTPPLSDEAAAAIREAAQATPVPAPDPSGLLEMVAAIRAQHVDPTNPIYAGHPERVAESETAIRAILLRAGIPDVPKTVEQVAAEQHAASFRVERNENLEELIASRIAEAEAQWRTPHGKAELQQRARELREAIGSQDYDALVTLARKGTPNLPDAALSDAYVLRQAAARGKYDSAAAAAKARLRP